MTRDTTSEFRFIVPDQYPYARYYPEARLIVWQPTGALDDASADRTVEFIEAREKLGGEAFNRYVDMTGYTQIKLSLDHLVRLARRRRHSYRGKPVKTAFYSLRLLGVEIARMYEELLEGSRIQVQTFRHKAAVAEWLEIPLELLQQRRNVE